MRSRLKVYDVRKRVDKPENGRKPCYLLICLYKRKSYLLLGEIDLMLWAKLWPQVHVVSPWALERIWLCFYPNISHCWVDFLGWFFFKKKINKIRHKDLEEKSARTWNWVPKTSPLSQQLRGSGTGWVGTSRESARFTDAPGLRNGCSQRGPTAYWSPIPASAP